MIPTLPEDALLPMALRCAVSAHAGLNLAAPSLPFLEHTAWWQYAAVLQSHSLWMAPPESDQGQRIIAGQLRAGKEHWRA